MNMSEPFNRLILFFVQHLCASSRDSPRQVRKFQLNNLHVTMQNFGLSIVVLLSSD